MGWSTRELADLAGTTVNTVRHYHRVGLLDEPRRRANGYKQYDAHQLARLLQVRRLRDLGVPLPDIRRLAAPGTAAGSADTDGADADAVLAAVDAELAAGIARLTRARSDLAALRRNRAALDLPPGFGAVAGRLSEADRAVVTIYARFYDDATMDDIRRMVEDEPDDISDDYEDLSPDATEDDRQALAERLAPVLAQHMVDYPWLRDASTRTTTSPTVVDGAVGAAMPQLYTPVQLDVLARATRIAHGLGQR